MHSGHSIKHDGVSHSIVATLPDALVVHILLAASDEPIYGGIASIQVVYAHLSAYHTLRLGSTRTAGLQMT